MNYHMSLADSLIADGSGHINLTLWQDNIKGCNNNQAYHFTELRVRIDNEVKFLSTTKETVITPINDPALTNLAVEGLSSLPLAIYTTVTVPFIHSIQDCQWIKNCTSCGKKNHPSQLWIPITVRFLQTSSEVRIVFNIADDPFRD